MVDVLGRGWSPTERQYRLIRLCVAILLVTSPTLVFASGYGQRTYQYQVAQIHPADGKFTYENDNVLFLERYKGLDCYPVSSHSCLLERELVDENRSFDDAPTHFPNPDAPFTYHDGQFYERVKHTRNDSVVLGLQPVSSETVIRTISRDFGNLPRPLERTVEEGTGTAQRDFDVHGQIVEYRGEYYVIYERGYSEPRGYVPSFFAALIGLVLLKRSIRIEIPDD